MSKRFNSFMAIAFAALLAWPTSASAQLLAPAPATKALKGQKAPDIRKQEALAKKFRALPVPKQAQQTGITKQKQTLLMKKRVKRATTPVIPRFGRGPLTVGGTEIWGMKAYEASNAQVGFMAFNTTNPSQESPLFTGDIDISYGAAIIDGTLYGVSLDASQIPYMTKVDTESWTLVGVEALSDYSLISTNDVATDGSGKAYGVFYNADASDAEFCVVDYSTKERTVIGPATRTYIATGITQDHAFYGLAAESLEGEINLYKVDIATGAETLVGSTGIPAANYYSATGSFYLQAGVADGKSNMLFWESITYSSPNASILYGIDLTSGEASVVYESPVAQEWTELMLPPVAEASKAPGKPTDFTVAFDGLNNYFIFTAPTTTKSGEELPKTHGMGYVLLSNGEEITRGMVGAGETKRVVIELPDGLQNVEVYCENAWGVGPKASSSIWVGYDVPIAPENVVATYDDKAGIISVVWDPVKKGAHNTFSVNDVVYDVYRICGSEKELVAENQKETTFEEEFATDELVSICYVIVAKNKVGESTEAASNVLTIGNPFEIPYTALFDADNCLDLFTIIDANEDDRQWQYDDYYNQAAIGYNSSVAMDDWLITPPINLKAGKKYSVVVSAQAASTSYPERMEVKAGDAATVEGMTETVIEAFDITEASANNFEGEFTPAADGVYYFGFHGISDADMFNLYINSIKVDEAQPDESPAPATNLDVVPDAEGKKKAEVLFNAPAKDRAGNDLTENLTKIEIYRDDAVIGTVEDVAPGADVTFIDEDETIESDFHTYYVIAYNAAGYSRASEKVTVYIGFDIPADIEDFAALDYGTSMKFSWSKVGNVGYNGGLVVPEDVVYNVYSLVPFWIWLEPDVLYGSVQDAEGLESEMGTLEGEQDWMYFGVYPTNEAGEGSSNVVSMIGGKPNELPIEDDFNQAAGLQVPFFSEASDDGLDYTATFSWAEDGQSIVASSTTDDAYAMICPGRITLAGSEKPTFMIDMKSSGTKAMMYVFVQRPGDVRETLAEPVVIANGDYTTYSFDLSKYKDDAFITPWIYIAFGEVCDVNLKNLKVIDLLDYNLAATLEAPKSVNAGQEAVVKVTVKNYGQNEAKGYTVKITADDKELELNETEMPAIAPMGQAAFTADFAPTIFDKGGDVTLKAEVIYDLDLNEANNAAERIISVKMPSVAGPEDVKIDGEVLSWNAPSVGVAEYTETFEDADIFEPFSLGGITADNKKGKLGDWSLYDGDGMEVYGFNGFSVPNLGEPQAAIVLDGAQMYTDPTGFANSGNVILGSFCPGSTTVPADDWIISPTQTGDAQTVKFFARQISSTNESDDSFYGYETFEVYYSMTDTEVESFTKVADYKIESADWTEFTIELPEGAKYFAIHHTSLDIFALLIDDVTYLAGAADIIGYNIYVDQEQVGSVEGNVTSFTIAGLTGAHEIAVTAVYANGVESLPVYVTTEAKGFNDFTAIEKILSKNEPFDVYTLNGVQVRKQTRSIEGLKAGVYVVDGMKVIIK